MGIVFVPALRAPRLIALAVIFASGLLGQDSGDVIQRAAEALRGQKAAALWILFDPAMPGYKKMQSESGALLGQGRVESTIEIRKDEGDDRGRRLEIDWRMRIEQGEGVLAITERHSAVTCRLAHKDGGWKIVEFAPLELFAPTHAAEAWEEIAGAAEWLTSPPDDAPVNPSRFLALFDPAMPGYDRLRAGVNSLARRGAIEIAVDQVSNDGDDRQRTLVVDWTLRVVDVQTRIDQLQKEQHVKLRMAWQGSRWRMVALDPIDFFGATNSVAPQ